MSRESRAGDSGHNPAGSYVQGDGVWGVLAYLHHLRSAAAFIIAGDFNKANLRQVMPNFHQHVSCPTRGPNTLDHCYSQFKNAYKARSLPAFGKSNHAAIFLTPEYKQRLAQEPRWRGKWRVGPPTRKLCYRRLLMTSTGTCSGRAHLTSASSRM